MCLSVVYVTIIYFNTFKTYLKCAVSGKKVIPASSNSFIHVILSVQSAPTPSKHISSWDNLSVFCRTPSWEDIRKLRFIFFSLLEIIRLFDWINIREPHGWLPHFTPKMLFHLSPGQFSFTLLPHWSPLDLEIPSHLKKSYHFFFWILQYFCFSLLLKYPGVNFLVFILRSSLSPWQGRDYLLMLNYLSNPSGVCKVKATLP